MWKWEEIQKLLWKKGYAFVARQQHIQTEKDDYYIDFASKYKLYLPTEDELRAEVENQKIIFELQQQNKQDLDNN